MYFGIIKLQGMMQKNSIVRNGIRMSKNTSDTIAGIDFEAWTEKESTIINDVIIPETYDKKVVAFLDLLGITQRIMSDQKGDEIVAVMERIKKIVDGQVGVFEYRDSLDYLYISDSFIFVCDIEQIVGFLKLLGMIQMLVLLECKVMLRGAIEYGDVTIRDSGKQIIGPAYVRAYLKQEHDAIFPRIILGNSIKEQIIDKNLSNLLYTYDREYALDYIDTYMETENISSSKFIVRLVREEVIKFLIENYKRYDEDEKPSVRAKYGYTINYFKDKGVWPNDREYLCW